MKLYFCLHQLTTDISNSFSQNKINSEKIACIPHAWLSFTNSMETLNFYHSFYGDNQEKSKIHWVWYTYKKL